MSSTKILQFQKPGNFYNQLIIPERIVIKINVFIVDDDLFSAEREAVVAEDQSTSLVFNSNNSLTLKAQRERLPIRKYLDQILYCLENHQILILVGETSCGKSTQIPQVSDFYEFQLNLFYNIRDWKFKVSNIPLKCENYFLIYRSSVLLN